MLSGLEERAILVLEDYHLINNSEIDNAVTYLLDHAPSRLQLVIVSRIEPNIPLAPPTRSPADDRDPRARVALLDRRGQQIFCSQSPTCTDR